MKLDVEVATRKRNNNVPACLFIRNVDYNSDWTPDPFPPNVVTATRVHRRPAHDQTHAHTLGPELPYEVK